MKRLGHDVFFVDKLETVDLYIQRDLFRNIPVNILANLEDF
jgi:hypothetical protein